MQYRKFGNTSFLISALGYGCMRLPEIEKEDGTISCWDKEIDGFSLLRCDA